MSHMLGYAVRHLGRRARESALLAGIILVAATVCLVQLAQRRGVEERARRLLVESLSGAWVLDAAAADEPVDVLMPQSDAVPAFDAAAARRRAAAAGLDATPRLRLGALVGHGDKSLGLVLHAVAPSHLARVAGALDLLPGSPAATASDSTLPHGALLSDVVAEYLGAAIGDTLAVLATNRAGYVSDGVLVVRGVFSTRGAGAFLTGTAFVPHEDGRELLGLAPGETTELVARPLGSRPADLAREVRLGPGAPRLRATSWERSAPLVDAVLRVWRAGGALTQAVFSCTAFLLLLNAILAKLHDRTRELGTLRALGLRAPEVVAAVVLEYVLLAWGACALATLLVAAGVAAASAHGIPLPGEAMQAAYMGRRLYPTLRVVDVTWVASLFTVVVLLATLAPIARAVRRQPAALLRTRT